MLWLGHHGIKRPQLDKFFDQLFRQTAPPPIRRAPYVPPTRPPQYEAIRRERYWTQTKHDREISLECLLVDRFATPPFEPSLFFPAIVIERRFRFRRRAFSHHSGQAFLNELQRLSIHGESPRQVRDRLLHVSRVSVHQRANHPRLIRYAIIRHDTHQSSHLQRRDRDIPLADGRRNRLTGNHCSCRTRCFQVVEA